MNEEKTADEGEQQSAIGQRDPISEELVLVESAGQGSPEAFEELYRRYQPRIYALVRQLAGRDSDPEQLVQDAFLQAFRHLGTLRDPSRFGAWLSAIARNAVLDEHRRIGLRPFLAPLDPALRSRAPDPFQQLLYREMLAQVTVLLQRCRIRGAFVRAMALGLTDREISRRLKCSVAAAKSQKFRLRRVLTRALKSPARRSSARPD